MNPHHADFLFFLFSAAKTFVRTNFLPKNIFFVVQKHFLSVVTFSSRSQKNFILQKEENKRKENELF